MRAEHYDLSDMAGLCGMDVVENELAAVTGDACDAPQLSALMPVLSRLRDVFGMEMVFVGQVRDGVVAGRERQNDGCNPFEEAYGRQVLGQRCRASVFDAVTVCSMEGIESGTLVCGARDGGGTEPPPHALVSVSRLLATSMRRMAVHA
jgi:hypothetical protein